MLMTLPLWISGKQIVLSAILFSDHKDILGAGAQLFGAALNFSESRRPGCRFHFSGAYCKIHAVEEIGEIARHHVPGAGQILRNPLGHHQKHAAGIERIKEPLH